MTGVFVVSLVSLVVVATVAIVPIGAAVPIVAAEAIVAAVVRRYGMQFVRLSHSGWKIVTQSD